MKKLVAFLLTVSILLTTLCMPMFAGATCTATHDAYLLMAMGEGVAERDTSKQVWYEYSTSTTHLKPTFYVLKCESCGEKLLDFYTQQEEAHTFENGICKYCLGTPNGAHTCTYVMAANSTTHWNECICGDKKDFYEHSYGSNGACVCGYHKASGCNHSSTEEVPTGGYYKAIDSTSHYYYQNFTVECKGCRQEMGKYTSSTLEKHYFKNGSNNCYYCAYPKASSCKHSKTQEMLGDDYYEQYNSTHHYYYEDIIIKCQDCKKEVSKYTEENLEKHYFKTGSNKCYYCGYPKASSCNHSKTQEVLGDDYYEKYNSTYHYYYEDIIIKCQDCKKEVSKYTEENLEKHYFKNGSNKCYYCKYEKPTYNEPPTTEVVPDFVIGIGEKTVYVNGKATTWSTPAQLISSTSYLPLKLVTQALGGYVSWNQSSLTATAVVGSKTIAFTSEQKYFYLNGYTTYMNNKAIVINGVMYVPAKDYFNIFGKITNYKDGYLVITNKWISQDEIEDILDYYYDTGYNGDDEEEPAYNQPNYLNEMKAGNLYAVSNDGHLYKRVYDASTTLGYTDQYAYTPKTSYDNFSLPKDELLIQKSGYLYDTDGNKICASVSTMLACDQRIGELKAIETGANNAYSSGTITSSLRNSITKSIATKVSEYQQVKRGTKTLSNIAEQKASYKAKTGSNSSTVTTIQQKLYDLGFTTQLVTGYYGSITFNNVAYFQITNNLDATGWVDSNTYSELFYTENAEIIERPIAEIADIDYDSDGNIVIYAEGNEACDILRVFIMQGNTVIDYFNINDNDADVSYRVPKTGAYEIFVSAENEQGDKYNTARISVEITRRTIVNKALEGLNTLGLATWGAAEALLNSTSFGLYGKYVQVYVSIDRNEVYLVSRSATDTILAIVSAKASAALLTGGGLTATVSTGAMAIHPGVGGAGYLVSAEMLAGATYMGGVAVTSTTDIAACTQELALLASAGGNKNGGAEGEKRLADQYGGQSQVYKKPSGFDGGRYIDQLDPYGIAHESKVGYTTLTNRVRTQILKDAQLKLDGAIEGAQWHFFRSKITGAVGASKQLLDFLYEHGIPYTIDKLKG